MKQLVFVYGSLKQGYWNNSVMQEAGGELLGDGHTESQHALYNLGSFPGVWFSTHASLIHGELYEVESLSRLDALEGYPSFYTRVEVPIRIDNTKQMAWMYVLNPQTRDEPSAHNLIHSGVWTG